MNRKLTYYCFALLIAFVISGCDTNKKRLNERMSFWRNDKIPYGTYVAYENLRYIFPKAEIRVTKKSPDPYKDVDWKNLTDIFADTFATRAKKVRIIICNSVMPDKKEIEALIQKAVAGEHIFISAFSISSELLDSFRIRSTEGGDITYPYDSLTVMAKDPVSGAVSSFTYPGFNYNKYVDSMDTTITGVLGYDSKNRPDLVKLYYENGGSIYFHFAPTAFTNFFLLHKNNMQYYNYVMSNLPKDATLVYWDEYFRNPSNKSFNPLSVILKNESLRWAFWIVIAIFGFLFLFQSKRRQRIVPILPKLRNTSLDFVKTIGRLYFQKGDNKNLAHKMSAHFLDHVRSKYKLPTSTLDDHFIERLAYKSNFNKEELSQIVYVVRNINDYPSLSDNDLMNFNKKLESFYKNA